MRLSTAPDRDEATSVAVLHAAFASGLSLFDTADAHCLDDSERGHNERLITTALATWNGDRSEVRVATKGGLTRPGGRWEADGRAKHLAARCEESRRALGVDSCGISAGASTRDRPSRRSTVNRCGEPLADAIGHHEG